MCMKDVEVPAGPISHRIAAMEPKSWPSCGHYTKPRVVIPSSASVDVEIMLGPPHADKTTPTEGLMWFIENSLLQYSKELNELLESKGVAESSPRLAHDFPTPPLSPEVSTSEGKTGERWPTTENADDEDAHVSVSWDRPSEAPSSPGENVDGLEIVNRLRSLKLSGYLVGEKVRVRCNKSKWHLAEVVKVNEDSVRLWVAAAKSTVDVPVQLLHSHLAKEAPAAPLPSTPRTPQGTVQSPSSTGTASSGSPGSVITTSSERSPSRWLGGFKDEPHAPSFVKSPVHAVRPAHLSHRQLYQQVSSAGTCTACQLPMLKGVALCSWECGHKVHFSCAERRFRQGLMECAECGDSDSSEASGSGRSDTRDTSVPTFLCVCGQLRSMKEMEEDPTLGKLCCPACQYNPWSIKGSLGPHRSAGSSLEGSPKKGMLARSSSGGFFDLDGALGKSAFSGATPSSYPSSTISSPARIRGQHLGNLSRTDPELVDPLRLTPSCSPPRQTGNSAAVPPRSKDSSTRKASLAVPMSPRRGGLPDPFARAPLPEGARAAAADSGTTSRPRRTRVRSASISEFPAIPTAALGDDLKDAGGARPVSKPQHRRRSSCASLADFGKGGEAMEGPALVDSPWSRVADPAPQQAAFHPRRSGIPPRSSAPAVTAAELLCAPIPSSRPARLRRTVSLDSRGAPSPSKEAAAAGGSTCAGPASGSSLWEQRRLPLNSAIERAPREHTSGGANEQATAGTMEQTTGGATVAQRDVPVGLGSLWAEAGQWISVVKNGKDVRPRDLEFERLAAFKEGNLGKETPEGKKSRSKEHWVLPLK